MDAAEPPAPLLEMRHVHTRVGRTVIHGDVSIAVYPGEVFGLAGGNGSGKTTLLREAILLRRPTSGTIKLFGEELEEEGSGRTQRARRRCGVMFQQGALFTSQTAVENAAAPLVEHTRLSRGLIREIAEVKLRLADFPMDSADKYPSELSGGMRRRASLARAIALEPELLFLDEPTAGLDPVTAARFDELVLRLKELLRPTIFMVTHDLDSLWRVADRVAVLGDGRILATGTMDQLLESPEPLVQEYLTGPRGRAAREASRGGM